MRLLKRLFKKRTPTVEMKKYLIVGLGNIGEEYQNTRHNIGFQILDHLAEKNQLSWEVKKLGSYSSLRVKGRQFILIKPNTYMNSCLLYTSPSPRDMRRSRMPSSA